MKEGDDFPQGDKTLRKEDHQAFLREFIFEIKDGKHQILEVVAEGEDDLPAGLQVRLASASSDPDGRHRSADAACPGRDTPVRPDRRGSRPLCCAPRA